ncbi:hypothetical protein LZ32DRAFT_623865, partial [Colletotrichum eremochloae]
MPDIFHLPDEAEARRSSSDKDATSSVTTLLLSDSEEANWKPKRDHGSYFFERHHGSRCGCGPLPHLTSLLLLISACLNVYLAFGRPPRIVVQHDVDVGCGAFPLGSDPSGYVPR